MLLVEDDPAVRAALLGALEAVGFEAVGTADAAEALEVLARRRVDVVVADYHLPGIAGLDLLAAIRGSRWSGLRFRLNGRRHRRARPRRESLYVAPLQLPGLNLDGDGDVLAPMRRPSR